MNSLLCWASLDAAHTAGHAADGNVTHTMTHFVIQLAVILIAARMGGSIFRRYLRLPQVLGELSAGILISPYALGGFALGTFAPLFPGTETGLPVSNELYALATLASILLLFLAGLETDLGHFIRYSGAASLVGMGGIIFSFGLGALCAVWFGIADSFMDPSALFLGTIATATSVGITARILSERKKTQSPEGVTIMGAAVIDDVLGIILLAVVVGVAQLSHGTEEVQWSQIGITAAKAFGFWLGCTSLAVLLAKRISRTLKISKNPFTSASMSLGLALLLAGFAEMAGLAMIIGAYIMGLALSKTDLALYLRERFQDVYELLVPVFFCVMGMLVDVQALRSAFLMGLVFSLLAILAKVVGCAVPAAVAGFNLRGSLRIGLGMLPRGEVALIVAGVGISSGIISSDLFGVSIMMTMVTTLLAPPLLIQALKGGSGLRRAKQEQGRETIQQINLDFPSPDIADFLMVRLIAALSNEEFFVNKIHAEVRTYQIRKDDLSATLQQSDSQISILASETDCPVIGLIVLEELINLEDLLESCRRMKDLQGMQSDLARQVFISPSSRNEGGRSE